MAKNRKTREDKIAISEKRLQSTQELTYSLSSLSSKPSVIPLAKQHAQTEIQTPLDVQKTFGISVSLIILELILYLLLHHHTLKLPFAQY